MYPQERQNEIMAILERYHYVTVAYLIEQLRYSSATVNRDLNLLQKQGLVRRSYGGVELVQDPDVPLLFRKHKQHHAKERIAQQAAALVEDGDILFVDGTTTTQCMGPYLAQKQRLTVITNNLAMIEYLSERGVSCICLGGRIAEVPSMTGDMDTVEMARSYRADKFFFSTEAVSDDGMISCGELYYNLRRVMLANSKEAVFLADSNKCEHQPAKRLCDFSNMTCVISDHDFSYLQSEFPNTRLIMVEV